MDTPRPVIFAALLLVATLLGCGGQGEAPGALEPGRTLPVEVEAPAGTTHVRVRPRASGDLPLKGAGRIEVDPLAPPQDRKIIVRGAGWLRGRVVDQRGAGLGGLRIVATGSRSLEHLRVRRISSDDGGQSSRGRTAGSATTDTDGRFAIGGLRPGSYALLARPDRSETYEPIHTGRVPTADEERVYRLQASRLRVRVKEKGGAWLSFDPRPYTFDADPPPRGKKPIEAEPDGSLACAKTDLRVVLSPVERQPALEKDDIRWVATEDPTIWEVIVTGARPMILRADALDRAGVSQAVTPGDLRETVALTIDPPQEPARLRLAIHDPPGTEVVVEYRLEIAPESGPPLRRLEKLSRLGLQSGESLTQRLLLPPGRFRIRVTPLTDRSGEPNVKGELRIEPGPAEAWVDLVPGANQPLTILTRARGRFSLCAPWGRKGTYGALHANSMEPLVGEPPTWTTAPGPVRVTMTDPNGVQWRATILVKAGLWTFVRPEGEQLVTQPGRFGDMYRELDSWNDIDDLDD